MSEQNLRKQLHASFKNRAMMYYHIFDALRSEVGEEKAVEIMKRGIHKRGREIGKQFAKHGPSDLEGLKDAFLGMIPDEGRLFEPEVLRCDAQCVEIKFHRCPLKEAWQEAGLHDEQIAKLTEIASSVDSGTFEGAGFTFSAETWKPGREGCCHLIIRPGK
ncbi:MAG: L-2-amino-thiazoline-4-carboxylic acid hydrolase [Candidatus Methylomirabilales bacterium]